MEKLGTLDGKEIVYIKIIDGNFDIEMPNENWVAVPIGDEHNIELYCKLADKCLDNNVGYVSALGKSCELIHDIFDETVVGLKVLENKILKINPMTDWEHNFNEGYWSSVYSSFSNETDLNTVVCIDMTERGVKNYLKVLTDKFEQDWLPPDEEFDLPIQPEYDN